MVPHGTQTSWSYKETSSEEPTPPPVKTPPPEMEDKELSIGGLSQTSYNRRLKQLAEEEEERKRLAMLPTKPETRDMGGSPIPQEEKTVRDIGIQDDREFDDAAVSAWAMSERIQIIEKDAPKPETRDVCLTPIFSRPVTP